MSVRGDGAVLDTFVSRLRDARYASLAQAEREAWAASEESWAQAQRALAHHWQIAARWTAARDARNSMNLGGAPSRT